RPVAASTRSSPRAASICVSTLRRSPGNTLFPYTTLFRSSADSYTSAYGNQSTGSRPAPQQSRQDRAEENPFANADGPVDISDDRSEEYTSELQSRFDVVCRLLLEKKNALSDSDRRLDLRA